MKQKDKVLNIIAVVILSLIVIWLGWSWLDVISHNHSDYQYSGINAFVLLTNACGGK